MVKLRIQVDSAVVLVFNYIWIVTYICHMIVHILFC